jgi:hypothetical protein
MNDKYANHKRIYADLKAKGHILFETVIGSQAHGTSTPKSDVDMSFVYMAPIEWLYARKDYEPFLRLSKDCVGYEIEYFLELVAANNPTIFECLFTPEDCWLLKHPAYDMALSRRHEFITKVAKSSYLGYAAAQIRKAQGMEKFQNWSTERTKKKEPIDFCWVIDAKSGYSTTPLKDFLLERNLDADKVAVANVDHATHVFALFHGDDSFRGIFGGNSDQVIFTSIPKGMDSIGLVFYNQDAYKKHSTDWKRYSDWKENANRDRWVETADGSFIDAKNIMHLVRLTQMNREIADGQGCIVRRPNREELLAIRNGEKNLSDIVKWAAEEEKEIAKLYETCSLKDSVDMDMVRSLLINMRLFFYEKDVKWHTINTVKYKNQFQESKHSIRKH